MPPTAPQRWAALGVMVFVYGTVIASIPFFDDYLGVLGAFVPVVHGVVCITGFVVAAFLLGQYAAQPQPAFLALASGYMLAGLLAFFHSLAFPLAYSATGLFGGPSTAGWLFVLWRASFALGVLAYVGIRRPGTTVLSSRRVAVPIALTVACSVIGACALTWIVTISEPYLPALFANEAERTSAGMYITIPVFVLSLTAILFLARRATLLDLWLMVTLLVALPDIIKPVGSRFQVGFYLVRSYELISSCAVLIALFTESSALYARLASAKALQAHGEAERLSSVEAAAAAIAHEVRQPLAAIRIDANTGVKLLHDPNPALADVGEILDDIEKAACRANDVIDGVRALVRRQNRRRDPLDINAIVSDAIKLVAEDVAVRASKIVTALSRESPHVAGDHTQIRQVVLNFILNGMNAMETVPPLKRRLTVRTAKRDGAVLISVSDCGRGISPENMTRLFEPFFTTRIGGMGLGLSIAKSIVNAHGGRIWAENNPDQGATFYFSLPLWGDETTGSLGIEKQSAS